MSFVGLEQLVTFRVHTPGQDSDAISRSAPE